MENLRTALDNLCNDWFLESIQLSYKRDGKDHAVSKGYENLDPRTLTVCTKMLDDLLKKHLEDW